jgi:uncharacterized protein YvpB
MESRAWLLFATAAAAVAAAACAVSRPTPPAGGGSWTLVPGAQLESDGADLVSSVHAVAPFDETVLSWNARPPAGSSIAAAKASYELRVRVRGEWTRWWTMGRADGNRYSSVTTEEDAISKLDVDTLSLKAPHLADAFQVRVRAPFRLEVRAICVAHWRRDAKPTLGLDPSPAWGVTLEVPQRSQQAEDPKIAPRICSPTALAMVLEYFGERLPTKEIAARVHDATSDLYGNWPCNTAVAADVLSEGSDGPGSSRSAFVIRANGFEEIESEIAQGRPVVISHRWKKGELTGAPIPASSGHLIVVVGFTSKGDIVANDPALAPPNVRRIYDRREIFHTWQENAPGIAYVFRPEAGTP